MRVHVINPNSTQSMTDMIGACARSVASPGTEIIATNPTSAPASIEGQYDEAMSLAGLLAEVAKGERAGADGFVVACFDDVGLGACREIATGPVLGICEAAMHAASMIATGFSVVTTLDRSVPLIEDLAYRYGMERRCRRVRAADIPVLALEQPGSNARQKLLDEITRSVREDRCEAVILGCAGMADLTAWLTEEAGVPVIDGVAVAVRMVEALVGAGLSTSKVGAYARPLAK
ncbi:MAG: aspartate/glutamate racemase family protein [Alphaproteobacteria bacterium]